MAPVLEAVRAAATHGGVQIFGDGHHLMIARAAPQASWPSVPASLDAAAGGHLSPSVVPPQLRGLLAGTGRTDTVCVDVFEVGDGAWGGRHPAPRLVRRVFPVLGPVCGAGSAFREPRVPSSVFGMSSLVSVAVLAPMSGDNATCLPCRDCPRRRVMRARLVTWTQRTAQ